MLSAALLLLLPGQVHLQGTTTADGGDYLLEGVALNLHGRARR